ncbi:MAG: CheR family methyltransferase [bacterium]
MILEDDAYFSKILDWVLQNKGFNGLQYKSNYMKRRIAVRMRATHAGNYRDYFHFLSKDPEETTRLLDRLTIHVTDFFRDPGVYEALKEKVVPEILRGTPKGTIKVWSAACSTGEESYSLASVWSECLVRQPGFSWEIWATDVDEASVQKAQLGEYDTGYLDKIPKKTAGKMFRLESGKLVVLPELRKRIRFIRQDLLGEWSSEFSGFDLIFCRNLLIYLTVSQQQKLYESFAKALRPGGFLVLGLTETLLGPARELYRCVDIRSRFYRVAGEADVKAGL